MSDFVFILVILAVFLLPIFIFDLVNKADIKMIRKKGSKTSDDVEDQQAVALEEAAGEQLRLNLLALEAYSRMVDVACNNRQKDIFDSSYFDSNDCSGDFRY